MIPDSIRYTIQKYQKSIHDTIHDLTTMYLSVDIIPYMTLLCHIQIRTFEYKTFRMESVYL